MLENARAPFLRSGISLSPGGTLCALSHSCILPETRVRINSRTVVVASVGLLECNDEIKDLGGEAIGPQTSVP